MNESEAAAVVQRRNDLMAGRVAMHDSGKRQDFETGAVRDTAADKPRIDLIPPEALQRWGEWMRLGAEKYSERNWEKGMPVSRYIASLHRHLNKYQLGDHSEDHLAAILFNAGAAMHHEKHHPDLCDVPPVIPRKDINTGKPKGDRDR